MKNPCEEMADLYAAMLEAAAVGECLECGCAECLGDLGNSVKHTPGILDGSNLTPADLALIKLAMELRKRPGLLFRAVYEEWDTTRVMEELY